jgi:ribosomal protein L19E
MSQNFGAWAEKAVSRPDLREQAFHQPSQELLVCWPNPGNSTSNMRSGRTQSKSRRKQRQGREAADPSLQSRLSRERHWLVFVRICRYCLGKCLRESSKHALKQPENHSRNPRRPHTSQRTGSCCPLEDSIIKIANELTAWTTREDEGVAKEIPLYQKYEFCSRR